MRFWLTEAAVLLLLVLAYRRGGQPERLIAITFTSAFFLGTLADAWHGYPQLLKFNPPLFLIDSAVLAAQVIVALRANRWWPLCTSALQLIVVIAHLAKLAEIRGMVGVFWGMMTIPTYLQFLCLLAGVFAHSRRQEQFGPYPDWREY